MKGSELRQDLVSGDWILIVPGRARKPKELRRKPKPRKKPKQSCPFEDPQRSGNGRSWLFMTNWTSRESNSKIGVTNIPQ